MQETVYTPLETLNKAQTATALEKNKFMDVLLLYGRRITYAGNANLTTQTVTVYTVPQGKTVYILASSLQVFANGTANHVYLQIQDNGLTGNGNEFTLIRLYQEGSSVSDSTSQNYTIPIRVVYGEKISLYNTINTGKAIGSIVGYEIDSSLTV